MTTMNLRTFLIGVIGFLIIFGAFRYIAEDVMSINSITPDPNLTESYNNITAYNNVAYNWSIGYQQQTEGAQQGLSDTGGEASVLRSVYGIIKLPFSFMSTASSIMTHTFNKLGLPSWVPRMLLAILMIVITSIILSIVTRSYLGW